MSIRQLDYGGLLSHIQQDTIKKRFNSKVFLTNNLGTYYALVEHLEGIADLVINISDPQYCTGEDTIPDIRKVISVIERNPEKNILITSVGEYLRVGRSVEVINKYIYSIIGLQAHSVKRVWLPLFAAKEEYLSVVGELEEEHFPEIAYEVEETPSGFETTVYAKAFASVPGIANAVGIRAWLNLWDSRKAKSGMSFATRFAKQLVETDGVYTLNVVYEPFQYFMSRVSCEHSQLHESLGTKEQWLFLASKAPYKTSTLSMAIERALNVLTFDPHHVLSSWNVADAYTKWAFWLWYKLGVNSTSDYISFAVSQTSAYEKIPNAIESAILQCIDNPLFEHWVTQRNVALTDLNHNKLSDSFWSAFKTISDPRKKMKILGGRTVEEKAEIIRLVSEAIQNGHSISQYKAILSEKYPDFLSYVAAPKYFDEELKTYISGYKRLKVTDSFDIAFSDSAEDISIYTYDTRSQLLSNIKATRDAYYVWVDGMGVEWIDLLVKKISEADGELIDPSVSIGTAVLPTVTKENMDRADPDTVSKKINDLDSLGHIKDHDFCDYYLVIAKQIELISAVAQNVVKIAARYPHKDIVITADHGMSRLAAKAFHLKDGVKLAPGLESCSLGRYCKRNGSASLPDISHTIKDNDVVAFRTHGHFTSPGFAPGEIHGGATPEEILVPVIHYRRKAPIANANQEKCSYTVAAEATIQANGSCELIITTQGPVKKVTVEIHGNRISATPKAKNSWSALIPNLSVGRTYGVQVYLNNIYSNITENFQVKAGGLAVDDDFDF